MGRKIYIADDEKNISDLMAGFLTEEGYDVKAFYSGDDLLDAFYEEQPDLVILDIMMPGTDGLSVSMKIRKAGSVPIIIVSARDSEIDRIAGINMGSDDYITKPFSPMELVARVNSIFRRIDLDRKENSVEKSEEYVFGNLKINTDSRQITIGDQRVKFTPTEYDLLLYLVKNKSKAVSREEMVKKVWKTQYDSDTRVTDDLVKRLRKKLKKAGCNVLIESVWGFGFKLSENRDKT